MAHEYHLVGGNSFMIVRRAHLCESSWRALACFTNDSTSIMATCSLATAKFQVSQGKFIIILGVVDVSSGKPDHGNLFFLAGVGSVAITHLG